MKKSENDIFGAPLSYSRKNVDLTLSPTFFLELEFVELDVFGRQFCGVGEVELFFLKWSATKYPLNIVNLRIGFNKNWVTKNNIAELDCEGGMRAVSITRKTGDTQLGLRTPSSPYA